MSLQLLKKMYFKVEERVGTLVGSGLQLAQQMVES
jgi:hypothetical protein